MYQNHLSSLFTTITMVLILALHYSFFGDGRDTFVGQASLLEIVSGKPIERISEVEEKPKDRISREEMPKESVVKQAGQEKVSSKRNVKVPQTKSQDLMKKQAELNKRFVLEVQTKDVTRLDLRKPSGLTAGQAEQLLEGTGLEGLGKSFVKAEKAYQVNAYYLMAHAAWESAWGKSRLSREKNNLFGFMAYDGSAYRSAKGFKTKEDSILTVARYVSDHYLNEDGRYYHGPHLKGMNVRYASDGNWGRGIGKVMLSLAKKTKGDHGKATASFKAIASLAA